VFSYLFEVRGAAEFAVVHTTVRDIETGSEQTMETIAQMLEARGVVKGIQEGRQQGLQEGLQKGRREMLLEMLQLRFGALPEAVRQRVTAADDAELGRWSRQLLQAQRLEDVFA
jgi:flagellar biosynthesis/type III secretory pathway protein FliH